MVKVRYGYVLWLSRYSRYSELLLLIVMLLRNMMLYWTGSVKLLYLENHIVVMCEHRTFTIVLLRTCTFH